MVILEELIYQQNPEWNSGEQLSNEKDLPKRQAYFEVLNWLPKRPIVALTGLRRVGKSTILRQIKEELPVGRTLYFSFERSQVKFHPDSLREILNWFFEVFLKCEPHGLTERVYVFLDEVQYIPFWQDVVKTYYDQSEQIKFFVSGSTSLFVKQKALESLAGRMVEIIVPPLTFDEFLKFRGEKSDVLKKFPMRKEFVNGLFENYLKFGEFPELVKDGYSLEQALVYLSSIEEKIIEQDLPKSFPIEKVDVLRLLFEFLKRNDGAIVELSNLAPDLGVDAKTVGKYLDYLSKAFLIDFSFNQTKKAVRAARTGKKVYLTSANFSRNEVSRRVENYVFNFLRTRGEVRFYRYKAFEVDFVWKLAEEKIPVEVKFRENLDAKDYQNLVKLGHKLGASRAVLVSKKEIDEKVFDGVRVSTIPAAVLELMLPVESDLR